MMDASSSGSISIIVSNSVFEFSITLSKSISAYSGFDDLTAILGKFGNIFFTLSSLSSSAMNNFDSLLSKPYSSSSPFHHEFRGTAIAPIEVTAI